jgi:hypothetical protein
VVRQKKLKFWKGNKLAAGYTVNGIGMCSFNIHCGL